VNRCPSVDHLAFQRFGCARAYACCRQFSRSLPFFAAALFIWSGLHQSCQATMVYGDHEGTNVMFLNVRESSSTDPEPLWGSPEVSGDHLVFGPEGFAATAQDPNGEVDLTDGTLAMTILAKPNAHIAEIHLTEAGDYTLAGNAGGPATFVHAAATVFVSITHIDGLSVNPVNMAVPMVFASTAPPNLGTNGKFVHGPDDGAGVIWQGNVDINVDQLLVDRNIEGNATKVVFTMNNTLLALNEAGTVAFIKKKNAGTGISVVTSVPEPSSLVLAGLGLAGLVGMVIRRRRKAG